MKSVVLFAAVAASAFGFADVDVYSPTELQSISQQLASKKTNFASRQLKNYGNHYTMVAFREATGSAEVHEKEADVFFVVGGKATIVTGGKLVNVHTEQPGELRGTSIEGGETHTLEKGAVIHIPAGVPHQLHIPAGTQFTYYVVKVTGQ